MQHHQHQTEWIESRPAVWCSSQQLGFLLMLVICMLMFVEYSFCLARFRLKKRRDVKWRSWVQCNTLDFYSWFSVFSFVKSDWLDKYIVVESTDVQSVRYGFGPRRKPLFVWTSAIDTCDSRLRSSASLRDSFFIFNDGVCISSFIIYNFAVTLRPTGRSPCCAFMHRCRLQRLRS
jgi:hypothetical protein